MSLWICAKHGLYGGQTHCPECGQPGSFVDLAIDDKVGDERSDLINELRYAAQQMWALPRETKNEMETLTTFSADAIGHLYTKAATMLAERDDVS